jgi:hypothetical protein
MDLYISSMLLGVVGLAAMALSGLGHQGHAGHAHGHGGHGHFHAGHGNGGHGLAGHARGSHSASSFIWAVMSPRFLFSLALGFGAVGELLRPMLGGPLLLVAALAGGVAFERFIVSPLWNLTMKFASAPALTLESAVSDEATAVTAFDANGQGIVSVEVDGQIVQILATLQPADRELGARVRAGQRVRIDDVHADSNRCVVSIL